MEPPILPPGSTAVPTHGIPVGLVQGYLDSAPPRGLPSIQGYEIRGLIGDGTFGWVFRGTDQDGREVAVKALKKELEPNDLSEARIRFGREVRILGEIKHANVVQILNSFEAKGTCYLVMELLQGVTLEQRLRDYTTLSTKEVIRIGAEVAAGLHALHEREVVHRDVKLSNIWLSAPGDRVKVLDLGLARRISGDFSATKAGSVVGTLLTIAPETLADKTELRSDQYSLGCVLYRLCTGRYPIVETSEVEQVAAIARKIPRSPRELTPNVSRELSDVVMRLLEKEPGNRFATMLEVIVALRQAHHVDPPTGGWTPAAVFARAGRSLQFLDLLPSNERESLRALAASCAGPRLPAHFEHCPAEAVLIGWSFRNHFGREFEKAISKFAEQLVRWKDDAYIQADLTKKIRQTLRQIVADFFRNTALARHHADKWPGFQRLVGEVQKTIMELQTDIGALFRTENQYAVSWAHGKNPDDAKKLVNTALAQLMSSAEALRGLLDENQAALAKAFAELTADYQV